jgi:hypothetical protein
MILEYLWKAAKTNAICDVQDVPVAGTPFVLNGEEVTYTSTGFAQFRYDKVWRSVSITAGAVDLSAITFTITGTWKGTVRVVSLLGPAPTMTVDTAVDPIVDITKIFDSVTSITANAPVLGASVGSGVVGQTAAYNFNHYASVCFATVTGSFITGSVQYSAYTTCDDIAITDNPFIQPVSGMNNVTANTASAVGPTPFRYLLFYFNDIAVVRTRTGAMKFTIVTSSLPNSG